MYGPAHTIAFKVESWWYTFNHQCVCSCVVIGSSNGHLPCLNSLSTGMTISVAPGSEDKFKEGDCRHTTYVSKKSSTFFFGDYIAKPAK